MLTAAFALGPNPKISIFQRRICSQSSTLEVSSKSLVRPKRRPAVVMEINVYYSEQWSLPVSALIPC